MIQLLKPQTPFVWPEPRAIEEIGAYDLTPPFAELVMESTSVFGIVSAVTSRGVAVVEDWLNSNQELNASLIVVVYPACATRQADLLELRRIVESAPERLSVHIYPLDRTTNRGSNALCFMSPDSNSVQMVTGPTQDFGVERLHDGHVNMVFRADAVLAESFKRYFDWLWARSRDITADGAVIIPDLVLPKGTEEGTRLWQDYMNGPAVRHVDPDTGEVTFKAEDREVPPIVAHVNPETGDVTLKTQEGEVIEAPTETLGLAKLDQLAESMARLYEKGALVSIDKLSRIPPLDAPLSPKLFGDVSELHKGNVTRKVSMRVSVIDEGMLAEIEKRRKGLRTVLNKFTFGLADGMRWMPSTARNLFEAELTLVNEEGKKLISDLLKGDVDAFLKSRREALVTDINGMYAELGRTGQVTDDVITKVVESLKERLSKTQSCDFMPKLSYSVVGFGRLDNSTASPWGQAFSLLADIATFPRKALTDRFFFHGLRVSEDDLIDAMNVADDALCRDRDTRGIKNRCKAELDVLSRIEKTPMDSRERCEFVWRILRGDAANVIDAKLDELEAA